MCKINIFATDADYKRLQELLEEAQDVANMLHRTVTVHTFCGIVEVHENEKEKEKEKDVNDM